MGEVHIDYKEIMEKKKAKISFNAIYENIMKEKEVAFNFGDVLTKKCDDKRKFGFEKYGEYSFQGSFENAVTSPTLEHAQEELIDVLNYLSHEDFKSDILKNGNGEKLKEIIDSVISIYYEIGDLIRVDKDVADN